MNSGEFFNSLDYAFIFAMFFSTAAGFIRGFVKDFFSTCAWYGAGVISVFLAPHLMPALHETVLDATIARCAAIGIAYLIVLVFLLLTVGLISRKVKSGSLSGVDRAVGVLFGLLRGVAILLGLCVAALTFEIPREKYSFIRDSKLSIVLFKIAEPFAPKITESELENERRPAPRKKTDKIEGSIPIAKKKTNTEEEPKKEVKEEDRAALLKIKDFIAEGLARRIVENDEPVETPSSPSPPPTAQSANKAKYGSMSLMEARAKRRAERKKKKIKREILKRFDKETR